MWARDRWELSEARSLEERGRNGDESGGLSFEEMGRERVVDCVAGRERLKAGMMELTLS